MQRFHKVMGLGMVGAALLLACTPLRGAEKKPPATLAEAVETWVKLLEKDDLKSATQWARDEQAAAAMKQSWARLRECHKQYDYRRWIDRGPGDGVAGAGQVGDATTFTVGGHDFGHMHVKWGKAGGEWRIDGVFACR